jgi:hypothetical protein
MADKAQIIKTDLPYEIDGLRYAYNRLQSGLEGQAEINVFIECFCVHARNLIDFFWPKQPKQKNHAIARQFMDTKAKRLYTSLQGADPNANGLYRKICDQIVHLTYDRTDDAERKIGPDDRSYLKQLIEKEIGNFSRHLHPSYRHLWNRRAEFATYAPLTRQGPTTTNAPATTSEVSSSPGGWTGPFRK